MNVAKSDKDRIRDLEKEVKKLRDKEPITNGGLISQIVFGPEKGVVRGKKR